MLGEKEFTLSQGWKSKVIFDNPLNVKFTGSEFAFGKHKITVITVWLLEWEGG